jgi:predicted nucleic acid-binding protein
VRWLALDTNVLVYAVLERRSEKGERCAALIKAAGGGVIPVQVLGEFLNVVRRRRPAMLDVALGTVDAYRLTFDIVPTEHDTLLAAAAFARRYTLQFWDAVIWQVSARSGATVLLSEDMQDGFAVGEMRVVGPFGGDPDLLALLQRR